MLLLFSYLQLFTLHCNLQRSFFITQATDFDDFLQSRPSQVKNWKKTRVLRRFYLDEEKKLETLRALIRENFCRNFIVRCKN